ncbi:hypothetical protein KKA95_04280 [Patescibacteria group bacterium]|nr:hypothetical protein [Patescibacteria group bacterium]
MSHLGNEHFLSQSDIILGKALELESLHPNARAELENNLGNIRTWLAIRLFRLSQQSGEADVTPALNAWNEKGYGLQSVSLQVKNPDNGSDVFLKDTWNHPTIGVVAPGMLEGEAELGIADFGIDDGKAESVKCLSNNGIDLNSVSKGTDPSLMPETLKKGGKAFAPGKTHVMRAVIELLKNPDSPRQQLRATLQDSGVYACEFELDS